MRMNLTSSHVIVAYDVTPWPSCLGVRCRPKRSFLAGSRCGLVFWRPASVYLQGVPSLDQNGRLYSIGDVKTCRLMIKFWRFHLRFPQVSFSMKVDIFVVLTRQIGVNRGLVGTQDTLASSPTERSAICRIHSPSFVNCMIS